jgi:serine/threonine protein kinase
MKPANLLVTPEGVVKVLDLGLAGSVIEGEAMRIGRVVGTMDFMAPEQIRSVDTVGPAADIYAIGCTLYFAITGEVPFPGGTRQEKAKRQLEEQPRPIQQLEPGVGDAFCRVVEAMMRKDPGERPPSAQAVIDLLKPWTPTSPLPMPRGKRGRPSIPEGDGAPSDVQTVGKATPSPASSNTSHESSQGANPSTRGLLSASEDTDRASEPQPDDTPLPAEVDWGRILGRSVGVAGVAAMVVVAALRLSFGFDKQPGAGLFGGGALQVIGWATFGLVMAIQLILALGRARQ